MRTIIYWLRFFGIWFAIMAAYYFAANAIVPRAGNAVFIMLLVGIGVGWILISLRRRVQKRQRYWASKTPMGDSGFLEGLPVSSDEQRQFCLALRKKFAGECKVAEQLILPEDDFGEYIDHGYLLSATSGIDILHEMGHEKADPMFVWIHEQEGDGPVLGGETVADYIRFYLKQWDTIIAGHRE